MKGDDTATGYGIDTSAKEFKVFGNSEEVQEIAIRIHIKNMTADGQRDFLERNMKGLTPSGKAKVGRHFRKYCKERWLKLDELFSSSEHRYFMNVTLRDFLNHSDRGKDDYTWAEVRAKNSKWEEIVSVGAQYHQTQVDSQTKVDNRIHIFVLTDDGLSMTSVYNRLNAKFVHEDGREAVFKYVGKGIPAQLITEYPDKGTFNYYTNTINIKFLKGIEYTFASNPITLPPFILPGDHDRWDVQPYYDIVPKELCIPRWNSFRFRNSDFWDFEEGQIVDPSKFTGK